MKYIYCRGGDKSAPTIAKEAGMFYGVRYDYTAYSDVYMLDAGLDPRWTAYKRKVKKHKPTFALVPDFEKEGRDANGKKQIGRDPIQLSLYIQDLREMRVPLIGVAPKFEGALAKLLEYVPLADDLVICESIPTEYSGYLLKDHELIPAKYHLLGGDIREHIEEIKRIKAHGGEVVSIDGSKLMMKAANGQIWTGEKWQAVKNSTHANALISAKNIMKSLGLSLEAA